MTTSTLAKLYTETFHKNWGNLAFSDYEGKDFTYCEVATIIKSLHLFYQITGLQRGDRIAVLGRNSAHWGAVFLSAISAGLVIVLSYPILTNADTNHIINHSETKLVIGAKSLLDKVDPKKSENLKAIVVIEDFSLFWAEDENIQYKLSDSFQYYKENTLTKQGFAFEEWNKEEMCVISYTSGTSGFTKGVMIPERSLVSNIIFAQDHMPLKAGDKIVSFLPMAHVYGLLFEFLFPVTLGCHITFLSKMPTPAIITKVFGEVKPHLVLSVPLVIEKIYKKRLLPTLQKPVMKILLATPGLSKIILKKIRAKLVETFGGRFFEIVIGGAPLSADVEKFFKRINFPFTIGYGMTECGPRSSAIRLEQNHFLVGRLIGDRMEVRIDSEDPTMCGESGKRRKCMLGYYKNEKATQEAFTKMDG
jgi:long-chain acyl-CoA synthetase